LLKPWLCVEVSKTCFLYLSGKDSLSGDDVKKEDMTGIDGASGETNKKIKDEPFDDKVKLEDGMGETNAVAEKAMPVNINDTIRTEMDKLMADNKRLENLVTEFHQRHHEITVKVNFVMFFCIRR
jgi:hypothetical protein